MSKPLPPRPNLEHLKKQAKSLLRAAHARETDALQRFAALPAFRNKPISELRETELALHDAQSVIAREHGFPSWRALREEVEAQTLSFDQALDQFVRAATGGAPARAERLLTLHPAIATASLPAALVLGNFDVVRDHLDRDPEAATRPLAPHDWEPLLYVCHTSMAKGHAERLEGLVDIARALCARGANPNAEYRWDWHPELPRTVLWGALCTVRHHPLAEVLLEAGANPTDGVSTHIVAGHGDLPTLELLHRYGMNVDGIPGGVPPLVYMMMWSRTPDGLRWLLEHGANPNLSWGVDDEAPAHVAARRWDVAMVELLLQHGADVHRRRADGLTPYVIAQLSGNAAIAGRLLAAGAHDELSDVDRFVAACARGDRSAATLMLERTPALRHALRPEHHLLLHRFAESDNVQVLETMLACGFDVNVRDKDAVTPLHRAAIEGHPDATRVLLAGGADPTALDGMFSATPLVWAVEGRGHATPGSDHVAVARLLIEAGCPLEWNPPPAAPDQEGTLEALAELRREALESGASAVSSRG